MDRNQTDAVRSFNRFVTRQIGALDESFLGRGRTLAQARLLYEIGRDGAQLRPLRTRLGLDSGYLSRLIRGLQKQGLLSIERDERDARRRVVRLTKKGLRELKEYDHRSDEFAASVLEPLDTGQRAALVAAMADVRRLLGIASLQVSVSRPAAPGARIT